MEHTRRLRAGQRKTQTAVQAAQASGSLTMLDRDQPVKLLHQRGMPELQILLDEGLQTTQGLRDRLTRG